MVFPMLNAKEDIYCYYGLGDYQRIRKDFQVQKCQEGFDYCVELKACDYNTIFSLIVMNCAQWIGLKKIV